MYTLDPTCQREIFIGEEGILKQLSDALWFLMVGIGLATLILPQYDL